MPAVDNAIDFGMRYVANEEWNPPIAFLSLLQELIITSLRAGEDTSSRIKITRDHIEQAWERCDEIQDKYGYIDMEYSQEIALEILDLMYCEECGKMMKAEGKQVEDFPLCDKCEPLVEEYLDGNE